MLKAQPEKASGNKLKSTVTAAVWEHVAVDRLEAIVTVHLSLSWGAPAHAAKACMSESSLLCF